MLIASRGVAANLLLSLAIVIFLLPTLLRDRGVGPPYPALSIALLAALAGLTVVWGRRSAGPTPGPAPVERHRVAQTVAAVLALLVLAYAVQHWVSLLVSNPFRTDMLVVIREAISRFLQGSSPYTTYRAYDAPWEMVMPYGPGLWGPYVLPHVFGIDLRVVSTAGALFVPLCCGWASAVEAGRGRIGHAFSWLVLLCALIASIDLTEFTVMGHTPVYWPLFPILGLLVTRERWIAAAVVLGVLIVARSTMVALAPCLLLAVWVRRRSQFAVSVAALAGTAAALLLPFVLWDARGVWDDMVASYPRLMKEIVWRSSDRGAIDTFGLTGWLLSRGWERFVEASQIAALSTTYVVAWRAMRRGASPLPWMGLSLLVFSMTSLWPVFYLYFDVFLLLACAAFAEMAGVDNPPGLRTWLGTAGALALVVLVTVGIAAEPFPSLEMAAPDRRLALLEGFGPRRADGNRTVRQIAAASAVFGLPRASRKTAVVVIDARTPDAPPQRVSARLNGQLLGTAISDSQWRTLRFPAPEAVWWFGFNRLELVFSEGHASLAVSRIGVEP